MDYRKVTRPLTEETIRIMMRKREADSAQVLINLTFEKILELIPVFPGDLCEDDPHFVFTGLIRFLLRLNPDNDTPAVGSLLPGLSQEIETEHDCRERGDEPVYLTGCPPEAEIENSDTRSCEPSLRIAIFDGPAEMDFHPFEAASFRHWFTPFSERG
jgi:hypothetical protein